MIVDSKIITKILFKDVFNDKLPYVDLLKNIIASGLNDDASRFIMHVMLNPDFKPLNKNDYFKVKVNVDGYSYTLDHQLDVLSDIGLYKDGYIYGVILDSDDYNSDFNEYHWSMKTKLLVYNTELDVNEIEKIHYVNSTIKTWELIKINKSEIKYFNNGNDKSSTS